MEYVILTSIITILLMVQSLYAIKFFISKDISSVITLNKKKKIKKEEAKKEKARKVERLKQLSSKPQLSQHEAKELVELTNKLIK